MRSCTGTPDNDLDHADWLNGPEASTDGPVEVSERCHHGRNKATCGHCAVFDCTPLTAEEIEMELQRVVLAKLAEIDRKRDEQMGADLAARFERGEL